jgi:nickel-dependent lactate racemase
MGSPPLSALIRPDSRVAIVVDDLTRLTPCRSILPVVLNELTNRGVREGNIRIIVALGTHRPMSRGEMAERYGERIIDRVEVKNHEAGNMENIVDLGRTAAGTPVLVNREFYEADVKVAIGNVIPHMYAGWSGGAKAVQPGVSSEATTYSTHIAAARIPLEEIVGRVENPVRQEIERVAKKAGLNFIVNTVLNERGELVKAFAGHMIRAHREAVRFAQGIFCPKIPSEADIVLASSYPADIDYWQAMKGAVASSLVVRKGGAIILLTPCKEGISPTHPEAEKYGSFQLREVESFVQTGVLRDLASAAFAMVQARIRAKAKLVIVSEGLSQGQCRSLGAEKAGGVEEAIRLVDAALGGEARVGVLKSSELAPIISS